MKAAPKVKISERPGRWLGRGWRGVAHREARAIDWLATQGIPTRVGRVFFWVVKLFLLGLLLYAAFWFALLLLFGVAGAWILKNSDLNDEEKLEWREGHSGFGLYDKNEWRRDMGDPDDPS